MDNKNIFKVKTHDDLSEILFDYQKRMVVMMFSAPWCKSCCEMTPKYVYLAQKYPQCYFVYIDLEDFVDPEKKYAKDIRTVPTFRFYLQKEVIANIMTGGVERVDTIITQIFSELNKSRDQAKKQKDGSSVMRPPGPDPPTAPVPTQYYSQPMPPTMPPAAMPPATMPPAAMPPATMQPVAMQPVAMPPAAMPPPTMQPAAMPPPTMQPAAIPPTTEQVMAPPMTFSQPAPPQAAPVPGPQPAAPVMQQPVMPMQQAPPPVQEPVLLSPEAQKAQYLAERTRQANQAQLLQCLQHLSKVKAVKKKKRKSKKEESSSDEDSD
jgi:thiol-disulfide isomerase/thioredoxin